MPMLTRGAFPAMWASMACAACGQWPAETLRQPATQADSRRSTQALADCAPLLQALVRARAREHVAQFAIDADLLPLAADPVAFRTGHMVHETENGRLVTHRLTPGQDPLVDALRGAIADGAAPCEGAGTTTFNGATVTRILFNHPQLDARHNPTTVLIDLESGMPVYHSYADADGIGYAWVYGLQDGASGAGPRH